MANVQIKHRYTDAVLFECEVPDEVEIGLRTRHALEKATAARADLRDANLSGADLSGAYLSGAKVKNLALVGERPFMSIGPIGSCMRTVFAWLTEDGLRIEAGCFFGTRDEFVEQLGDTHGENEHAQEYTAALVLFDKHAELWTPAVVEQKVSA